MIIMMSSDKESDMIIAARIVAEQLHNISDSLDSVAEAIRDNDLPDLSSIAIALEKMGAFTDVFHQVEHNGSLRIDDSK
tara:strand:- start:64 stop:300 length:237 start_codon:yes stop_codon:yes gene_type:complete